MVRLAVSALAILAMAVALRPALAGERLLVPELPGWKTVFQHADAATEGSDFIPGHETVQSWSRRLSVQAFRDVTVTVPGFLDMVARRTGELCDGVAAAPSRSGVVDGIEVGMRSVSCARFRGGEQGEHVIYYALRGRDALYVVHRAWRGPAFPPGRPPLSAEELEDWTAYLRSVRLCDSSDPRRPCAAAR